MGSPRFPLHASTKTVGMAPSIGTPRVPSFNGFDIKSPNPGNRSCDGKGTSLCQSRFPRFLVMQVVAAEALQHHIPKKKGFGFLVHFISTSLQSTCLKFLKIGVPKQSPGQPWPWLPWAILLELQLESWRDRPNLPGRTLKE